MTHITVSEDGNIILSGDWTLDEGPHILSTIKSLSLPDRTKLNLDGTKITSFDSSGALTLCHLLTRLRNAKKEYDFSNFDQKHENLLTFTKTHESKIETKVAQPTEHNFLYNIGEKTLWVVNQAVSYTNFIGELSLTFSSMLSFRKKWHWRHMLNSIEHVGYNAIPIISLLIFLVGIVLSYQLGLQLENYGANIFIVNLTGLAVLREFGPLIAAIIVAGRTSSAFTAEIGLMKMNEELDALKVMGMSPLNRIAIPKIFAVVIAMPLLTIVADVFGVFGSMVMSEVRFGITMQDFIARFDDVTETSSLWTGLSKSPVFGLVIASVGCFQGFQVEENAESIGRQTTKSVVQAIFLVIIVDALFSVMFSMAGI